nr:expressed protein [Hymenolepis microstoma]
MAESMNLKCTRTFWNMWRDTDLVTIRLATASLVRFAAFTTFAGLLLTTFALTACFAGHRARSLVVRNFELPWDY